MGELPKQAAHDLLQTYFDISRLSKEFLNRILEEISYNGRGLEFVFRHLAGTLRSASTDEVTEECVEACVSKAFISWSGAVANQLYHDQLQDDIHELSNFLLLLYTWPENYHAKVDENDVLLIPMSEFPEKWAKISQSGALRLVIDHLQNEVGVIKPKGFLFKFLSTCIVKRPRTLDTLFFLGWNLAAACEHIGSPGHRLENAVATGTAPSFHSLLLSGDQERERERESTN